MKKYERLGHTIGRKRTTTYLAWRNMIQRCTNSNRPDFHCYGGRGISVCLRWLSFGAFLADMGERPEATSLDRRNNSLGYSPDNCRWATKHEQMQNTRATRLISHNGLTMGIAAWARKLGINKETVRSRIAKGWPLSKALSSEDYRGH
jgi:hypothetical protein